MLIVSELFIYPIKSLGGIPVSSVNVTDRGFTHDRRWMLVDANNRFLTQREFPEMALLQVALTSTGLKVYSKTNIDSKIDIPFYVEIKEEITVEIFDESCNASLVGKMADEWFSERLSAKCRLVYMPDTTRRLVDENYAINDELTAFSDGYPFLIIGQSSLEDLNRRLANPLPINRFRPNIVFTGGDPYEEDCLKEFKINNIIFYGVKLCARCTITTVNQDDASKAQEPLRTLASYRQKNNKIYFGQNLLHSGEGVIKTGDKIEVVKISHSEASSFF